MLRAIIGCLLVALVASQCADPLETLVCQESANGDSNIELQAFYGPRPCVGLFDAASCNSAQQQLYEFDLYATLDFTSGSSCTVALSTDNAPLAATAACTTQSCNGTVSDRCGFIALGGLSVQLAINNVRYRKQLLEVGQFPYDYVAITQYAQYSDLANPAGSASPLQCITECFNGSVPNCSFRASDSNGTYCYNENAGDFAAAVGPSSFNCVSVQQPVFEPHTPDLTQSCCGDCESCACALEPGGSTSYVAYFPQSSPAEAYQLSIESTSGGFQLDAETGGMPGVTYNTDSPLFVGAVGWPLNPEAADAAYYTQLNACPGVDPGCAYAGGLWIPALRRDPVTQAGFASDVDGKLGCGYCTQGMPALRACGDPAVPALVATQSYVMGMSPVCRLWAASDDSTLLFDATVTVTGNNGATTVATFANLGLENQQIVVQNSDGTVFLTVDFDTGQTPLDDPLITDSYFATCAPDSAGDDLFPLDPATWPNQATPWSDRIGTASGLPNCFGCMPDEQSNVPGEIRLWWYMNATLASQFVNLGNVGGVQQVGVTNRIVQQDDCDNLYGNFSGCAVGTQPGLQTNVCAAGGMSAVLPTLTAAQVARVFNNYRQVLAAATTKAFGPLATDVASYLPPSWTYQSPNFWIEAQGDMVSVVYQPATSLFENAAQQNLDVSVFVDVSLAALPQATPPVVIVPGSDQLYTCAMCNQFPPRIATGTVQLQIDPRYVAPFPITYYVSAQAGDIACLIEGQLLQPISLQSTPVLLELDCDASSADAAPSADLPFTLTVARGSIVSLLYERYLCPGIVATMVDPALGYSPDIPPANVSMLNTTLGAPLLNDDGPGTPVALAKELFSSEQSAGIVYSMLALGALLLAFVALSLMILVPLIKNELKLRHIEKSRR